MTAKYSTIFLVIGLATAGCTAPARGTNPALWRHVVRRFWSFRTPSRTRATKDCVRRFGESGYPASSRTYTTHPLMIIHLTRRHSARQAITRSFGSRWPRKASHPPHAGFLNVSLCPTAAGLNRAADIGFRPKAGRHYMHGNSGGTVCSRQAPQTLMRPSVARSVPTKG